MDLRRIAQANAANSTPVRSSGSGMTSGFSSPSSPTKPSTPVTPVNRVSAGVYRSPASTPSISSTTPFDWEAARSKRPPPFGSPLQGRNKGPRPSLNGNAQPKRFVKKKGFFERIMAIPSAIAFEIAVFPNNLPLPSPSTSAYLIGGTLHLINLYVRVCQVSNTPDSNLGWEDMYRESKNSSWFDWTIPLTMLLISGSFLNAVLLFSRIKLYRLHRRADPVASPNAVFVEAHLDFQPLEPPSLVSRFATAASFTFSYSWRWLFGLTLPVRDEKVEKMSRVQQLQVWTPGPVEMMLFCVYSPVHAFLWLATGSSNWILMTAIMVLVGVQLNAMMYSYTALVKDREIIAAEVMHEYNEGFVYPRINPIRKDVAVMTHQSEVVNVWED